jgi:hypothetical protein
MDFDQQIAQPNLICTEVLLTKLQKPEKSGFAEHQGLRSFVCLGFQQIPV